MKKKRRLKKQVYYVLIGLVIFIIAIVGIVKHVKYINSYEYKLSKVGYNENEIKVILKLTDKQVDEILERKYNSKMITFMKQKYFIYNNLDRYLAYQKENKSEKVKNIVTLVNVKADYDWYDEEAINDTDTSLGNLMIANKFYHLSKDFVPEELEAASNQYSYDDNSATKEVLEAFKNMWRKAKDEDLNLIITSSYRSYDDQEKIWDSYANKNGEEWADLYAPFTPKFASSIAGSELKSAGLMNKCGFSLMDINPAFSEKYATNSPVIVSVTT